MAKYGMNRVTLIGNLGKDPKEQLRYLDQGIAVCTVSMACTERSRDREGNWVDRTDWIDVNLWRGNAELVSNYCRKGSTICVEGRIITRSWDTPEGEKRYKTEVQASKVILLDSRPSDSQASNIGTQTAAQGFSGPSQPYQTPVSQPQHPANLASGAGNPSPSVSKPSTNTPTEDLDDLPF